MFWTSATTNEGNFQENIFFSTSNHETQAIPDNIDRKIMQLEQTDHKIQQFLFIIGLLVSMVGSVWPLIPYAVSTWFYTNVSNKKQNRIMWTISGTILLAGNTFVLLAIAGYFTNFQRRVKTNEAEVEIKLGIMLLTVGITWIFMAAVLNITSGYEVQNPFIKNRSDHEKPNGGSVQCIGREK